MIQCRLILSNKNMTGYSHQDLEEIQGLEIGADGVATRQEAQTDNARLLNK